MSSPEELIKSSLRAKFATLSDFIKLCKSLGGKYNYRGETHECIITLKESARLEIRAIAGTDKGFLDLEVRTQAGKPISTYRIPISGDTWLEIIGSMQSENPTVAVRSRQVTANITSIANYMRIEYDTKRNVLRLNVEKVPKIESASTQLMVLVHKLGRGKWFTPERLRLEAYTRGISPRVDIREFLNNLVEAGLLKKRIRRGLRGERVVEYTLRR